MLLSRYDYSFNTSLFLDNQQPMDSLGHYQPLLRNIAPPTRTLFLLVILLLGENGLSLCSPWLAGQFTSALFSDDSTLLNTSYKNILFLWFLLVVFQASLGYFNKTYSGLTSERMLVRLRNQLYDHLQGLPLSFHNDKKQGETLTLLTNDASIVSNFITSTLVSVIPLLITATGAVIMIGFIRPGIALLVILLLPIFYIVIKILGRRIRPLSRSLIKQYSATVALAQENLSTLAIIKSFIREPIETANFSESNELLYTLTGKYIRAQARLAPLIRLSATALLFGVLLIIGDDITSGKLSPGELVSLMLYGMLLTQPVSRLADIYGQTQRTRAAADRILGILSQSPEEVQQGETLPPVKGHIRFAEISFHYQGGENVLTNLSLEIKAGETIAITGENGAGKSTLAHVLMRFCIPQQGAVYIDEHDASKVSLISLRRQIGLVQQNILLQNSSVAENIRFGRPDATDQEVEEAAKAARAMEFITQLPAGFDTVIGDQGIKLSGGQKQRLSLARALLTDPPILILDEATAMFDPEGEKTFLEENRQLLNTRTVIIITHRPASLALADRIIRLENGTCSTDIDSKLVKS